MIGTFIHVQTDEVGEGVRHTDVRFVWNVLERGGFLRKENSPKCRQFNSKKIHCVF
jgi:hypothetical protein